MSGLSEIGRLKQKSGQGRGVACRAPDYKDLGHALVIAGGSVECET